MAMLFASCIFNPSDDDNLTYVNPDYAIAPVEISLLEAGDTIEIGGPVTFHYDVSGYDPGKPYVIAFHAGEFHQLLNDFSGSINYEPGIMKDYLEASLTVSTNSGTHSLADRNSQERIFYERKWILDVNTQDPTEGPEITSIVQRDGTLQISWKKHVGANFKSYSVYRNGSLIATTEDANVTSVADGTYLGGETSYSVKITVASGAYAWGIPVNYAAEVPKLLKWQPTADGRLKAYWSASRFPENFQRYDVYAWRNGGVIGTPEYSTTHVPDTTCSFTPVFGSEQFFTVLTYPKVFGAASFPTEGVARYLYGEETEPYQVIAVAPGANRYFTRDDEILRAFTIDTNELIASAPIDRLIHKLIVSVDENTIIGLGHFGDTLYEWAAADLQLKNEVDMLDVFGIHAVSIGSAGNDLLLIGKGSSTGNSIVLYNTQTGVIEKEYFGNVELGLTLQQSSDGRFLIIKDWNNSRLVKMETNNTITELSSLTTTNVFFDPQDDTKIVIGSKTERNEGAVYVQDRATLDLLNNIQTPPMTISNLDPVEGIVFGRLTDDSGDFVAFDYKDQKLLKRLKPTSESLELSGNYLYSPYGARLLLK